MLKLSPVDLADLSRKTLAHYEQNADAFWDGTRDHDVSQNIDALLTALGAGSPRRILDLGCGPGRDLAEFRRRGHCPVGLDGCEAFVRMARLHAGVPVLHQDFLALDLGSEDFDGVFANASLFHVPTQELPRVLGELWACLSRRGVLFCSNPRGDNRESVSGGRFGAFHDEERWQALVTAAGFDAVASYYRPEGVPREQQPWLATLWRKRLPAASGTSDAGVKA